MEERISKKTGKMWFLVPKRNTKPGVNIWFPNKDYAEKYEKGAEVEVNAVGDNVYFYKEFLPRTGPVPLKELTAPTTVSSNPLKDKLREAIRLMEEIINAI